MTVTAVVYIAYYNDSLANTTKEQWAHTYIHNILTVYHQGCIDITLKPVYDKRLQSSLAKLLCV